mmetsp:Transcript_4457/g.14451  ORF Transcript_4457/g.14451 Transcript_4457/m.14451 type:complete len:270 (-) Transcript_4457:2271-3080(-)
MEISRAVSTRLKSSCSSSSSGFTWLSSAPWLLRKLRSFSYCPRSCSAWSFLLALSLVTLPCTVFPASSSTSSIIVRPLDATMSDVKSPNGPLIVDALSHLMRAGETALAADSAGGSIGRLYCLSTRATGPFSGAEVSRSSTLADMKLYRDSTELSATPVTGTEKRLPSSSRKSMLAVKLMGLLETNDTTTGSLSLAIPRSIPSGKSSWRGRRCSSGGRRYLTSRLSYPSLTTMNVVVDAMPRGTVGRRISRVSNLSLGQRPVPRTVSST